MKYTLCCNKFLTLFLWPLPQINTRKVTFMLLPLLCYVQHAESVTLHMYIRTAYQFLKSLHKYFYIPWWGVTSICPAFLFWTCLATAAPKACWSLNVLQSNLLFKACVCANHHTKHTGHCRRWHLSCTKIHEVVTTLFNWWTEPIPYLHDKVC